MYILTYNRPYHLIPMYILTYIQHTSVHSTVNTKVYISHQYHQIPMYILTYMEPFTPPDTNVHISIQPSIPPDTNVHINIQPSMPPDNNVHINIHTTVHTTRYQCAY